MTISRYPGKPYIAPKRPIQWARDKGRGGNLVIGPVQINWYGVGWRIHITWPVQTVISHA